MINTFTIALREGLEASLIVGILLAYVAKTGRRSALPAIWSGVGLAIALSFGFGAFLSFTSRELSESGEELFAGVTSITAVGLVTFMVFWMKKTARTMSKELHSKLDDALAFGSFGLISTAFLSVIREGLETSLFVYASFKTVSSNASPSIGLVLGFAASITIGAMVYRKSLKLNLATFFKYTGIGLLLVASSVLHVGLGDLASFGILPDSNLLNWLVIATYLVATLRPLLKTASPTPKAPAAQDPISS